MSDFDYLGKRGIVIVDPGTLRTDRFGLDSCTAVFSVPHDQFRQLPKLRSAHPIFKGLTMETREMSLKGGFAVATGNYVGLMDRESTEPVSELIIGTNQEPIATHPRFKQFAGTAKAPLNGAVFIHSRDQSMVSASTVVAQSEVGYTFMRFESLILKNAGSPGASTERNKFAGMEQYLDAGATYRQTWCTASAIPKDAVLGVGFISPAPIKDIGIDKSRNWLFLGISSQQRGECFVNNCDWRLSGIYGWNDEVYKNPNAPAGGAGGASKPSGSATLKTSGLKTVSSP